MFERIKRVIFIFIGYLLLFTFITYMTSLIKKQEFQFDIWLDLIAAIFCAVATEFFPKPKKQ